MFKRITNWFKRVKEEETFSIPIDEEEIFKKSKLILQQLDEYITTAELESEDLCVQLDSVLTEQSTLERKIKDLNKPESWHERNLLLKLDRLVVHGNNLRQRIELYSQNIKVYLNLMSRVEDIRVMRLNGLDTDKIQDIWLEFETSLGVYKEKIATEAVTETKELITSSATEDRLNKLRQQVFGKQVESDKQPIPPKIDLEQALPGLARPPLDKVLSKTSDRLASPEMQQWSEAMEEVVERLEQE